MNNNIRFKRRINPFNVSKAFISGTMFRYRDYRTELPEIHYVNTIDLAWRRTGDILRGLYSEPKKETISFR